MTSTRGIDFRNLAMTVYAEKFESVRSLVVPSIHEWFSSGKRCA